MKIIFFADLGLSNYIGPVVSSCAPSDPETVSDMLKAVLEALPKCDLVNFQKLPEKIGDIANPFLQLPGIERFREDSHDIKLDGPWAAVKEKVMSSRDRSNIRRRRKLLSGEGAVVLEHHCSVQAKSAHIGNIIAMQNERFESVGSPIMPDFWQEFYRRLVKREIKSSFNICISTLTVSGEPIASTLGIVQEHFYQGILSTFTGGKWYRFSPGILMIDALLEDFPHLTKSGKGYFDFSTGNYPYKRRLGCRRNPLYEYMQFRSIRGLMPYMIWRIKTFLRRRCPRFLTLLKKMLKRTP